MGIKKIIRAVLMEVMDSTTLPPDYRENNGRATFTLGLLEYWVKFTPFEKATPMMVEDEKILQIINNANNKYIVDFGIVQNDQDVYNVKTNANNIIQVMRFVNGVILKFVNDHSVNVLTYVPNSEERDRVFKMAVKNLLTNDFTYYRAKEHFLRNVFLISKNIQTK